MTAIVRTTGANIQNGRISGNAAYTLRSPHKRLRSIASLLYSPPPNTPSAQYSRVSIALLDHIHPPLETAARYIGVGIQLSAERDEAGQDERHPLLLLLVRRTVRIDINKEKLVAELGSNKDGSSVGSKDDVDKARAGRGNERDNARDGINDRYPTVSPVDDKNLRAAWRNRNLGERKAAG